MTESIVTYLRELTDFSKTRIILYPNDVRVETQTNWWSLGRGASDSITDLPEIEEELRTLAYIWVNHFTHHSNPFNARRATFYSWYDELAGHLNVCMVSQGAPSFDAPRAIVDSPQPILQQLLKDPAPGTIPLSELGSTDSPNGPAPGNIVWVYTNTW